MLTHSLQVLPDLPVFQELAAVVALQVQAGPVEQAAQAVIVDFQGFRVFQDSPDFPGLLARQVQADLRVPAVRPEVQAPAAQQGLPDLQALLVSPGSQDLQGSQGSQGLLVLPVLPALVAHRAVQVTLASQEHPASLVPAEIQDLQAIQEHQALRA